LDDKAASIAQRAHEDAAKVKAQLVERELLVAGSIERIKLIRAIISFIGEPLPALQTSAEVPLQSAPIAEVY